MCECLSDSEMFRASMTTRELMMVRIVVPVVLTILMLNGHLAVVAELPRLADFEGWCEQLDAGSDTSGRLYFSEVIGPELDQAEREQYWLLPAIIRFRSAHMMLDDQGRYQLEYTVDDNDFGMTHTRRMSAASVRLTRLHCWLVETYRALPTVADVPLTEDERLRRVALRYATFNRYDLVRILLKDLVNNFPGTEAADWAAELVPEIDRMLIDQRVLVWDQTSFRSEGRNDLKLFGGYYGVWLGMAIPIALESNDASAYGLGLLVGGPLGYTLAKQATRHADISEGRATMIALGGNFGTWQGLGWAAYGDADGSAVVGTGVATGLLGLAGTIWLTNQYEFTEGHAALTDAGMSWGAWFGMVAAGMTDATGDDVLAAVLLGSDALVLTAGVLGKDVVMSEKRVRLIGLNGVLGTVMGFGVDLLFKIQSGQTAWAIAGAGGVAGLVWGFHATSGTDGDLMAQGGGCDSRFMASTADRRSESTVCLPSLMTQPDFMNRGRAMPAIGMAIRF